MGITTEQSSKKRKAVEFLERYAIPSFKHVAIHISVAIVLLVLFFIILRDIVSIDSISFVGITSSISAASGALLAISIALAIFFSSHITSWRDKHIERLERGRAELANQMAKSAKQYPEISRRLSTLYEKSAFYVTGQAISPDDIFDASRVYDEWAKEEALKAIKDNRKFDFGNLGTYESYEKHLFDSSLCSTKVRESLVLLSIAEKTSRVATVFPPSLTAWAVILLISLIFATLGSIRIFSVSLYFPMLLMLLYLIIVALIALIISSSNIIMFITRGLEKGHEIAIEQLASRQPADARAAKSNEKKKR